MKGLYDGKEYYISLPRDGDHYEIFFLISDINEDDINEDETFLMIDEIVRKHELYEKFHIHYKLNSEEIDKHIVYQIAPSNEYDECIFC